MNETVSHSVAVYYLLFTILRAQVRTTARATHLILLLIIIVIMIVIVIAIVIVISVSEG